MRAGVEADICRARDGTEVQKLCFTHSEVMCCEKAFRHDETAERSFERYVGCRTGLIDGGPTVSPGRYTG